MSVVTDEDTEIRRHIAEAFRLAHSKLHDAGLPELAGLDLAAMLIGFALKDENDKDIDLLMRSVYLQVKALIADARKHAL